MTDYYRAPALVLTLLLLPAFAYLFSRYRSTRTLLWFLGVLASLARMGFMFFTNDLGMGEAHHPWLVAGGMICAHISSGLFLASLTPRFIYICRIRILYAFVVPLIFDSLLLGATNGGAELHGPVEWLFLLLSACTVASALVWGWQVGSMPPRVGAGLAASAAVFCYWIYFTQGPTPTLYAIDSATHFLTAVLVLYTYRRLTAGALLTALGFLTWSLTIFDIFPHLVLPSVFAINLIRAVVFAKVIAVIGMILLTLEDELASRRAAQARERKIRLETEAYANLVRAFHLASEFDARSTEFCQAIVEHSRFAQAALLTPNSCGHMKATGSAGLSPALRETLAKLVKRIPLDGLWNYGAAHPLSEHGSTFQLDLGSWLAADESALGQRLARPLAIPLAGETGSNGALLLYGLRPEKSRRCPEQSPTPCAEEMTPLENLAARLGAARQHTLMMEKLIQAEKFASVGQLVEKMTIQLSNPLTVILGYASLLEDHPELDSDDHKCVTGLLSEARRMKSTLESLTRLSSAESEERVAVSLAEMIGDLAELHQPEFALRSIELDLRLPEDLPRALCHARQIHQAIQQCLLYCAEAIEAEAAERRICVEAQCVDQQVQVSISHSGAGFQNPAQVFDPRAAAPDLPEELSLGLSLCARLLRENEGRASAINLKPRGAAILLQLHAS